MYRLVDLQFNYDKTPFGFVDSQTCWEKKKKMQLDVEESTPASDMIH